MPIVGEQRVASALTFAAQGTIRDSDRAAACLWAATQQGGMVDEYGLIPGWINLQPNGDFESALSPSWSVRGTGAIALDPAKYVSGSQSLRCDVRVNSDGVNGNYVAALPRTSYTISGMVWAPAGRQIGLVLLQFDSTHTYINNPASTNVTGTGGWIPFTATGITASNAAYIAFTALAADASFPAYSFWIDTIQIETGSIAHSFVNGTQPSTNTPGSGVGIWRAATNLFRRGQCDATTDWNTLNSSVMSVDATTPAPFSPQAIAVRCDGSLNNQGVQPTSGTGQALAAGGFYGGAVYFKGVKGSSYAISSYVVNTDSTTGNATTANFVATGEWQRIEAPVGVVATGKTGDRIVVDLYTASQRAETFWVAHAMIEKIPAGSGQALPPIAPYVATSGGATASRTPGEVWGPSSLVTPDHGWIALAYSPGHASSGTNGGTFYLWRLNNTTGTPTEFGVFVQPGSPGFVYSYTLDLSGVYHYNAIAATWAKGDVIVVILKWDTATLSLSVNGSPFQQATMARGVADYVNFHLGAYGFNVDPTAANGRYLGYAMGKGTLSDADAKDLATRLRTGRVRHMADLPAAA